MARPKKDERPRRSGRVLAGVLGAFALGGAVYLGARISRDAGPTGWNLVLVSVDTLRADHLSSYGAEGLRTPGIDRLAEKGVLFEQAATVAPTTLPAHASLLTGTTPIRHGVRDNVGFYLPPDVETLSTHLKRHGYQTAAFVGAFVLDGRFGLARGFDTYDDDLGDSADDLGAGPVAQRTGDRVLSSALAWLEGRGAAPFFAFIHFYDPHAPYTPPEGFAAGTDDLSRYRGEVLYVDSLVGKLLDWIDARKLGDRTLVVLTSDHGESLGEHGELSHGYFVYESTLSIPLVLRYPGAPRGRRVGSLARIVDVAPTVLELLGLPSLENAEGESLVPLITGIEGESVERSSYAETFVPRVHYGWSELRSLRRGDKKLVLAPRPELYDLASDPDESRNRIEEDADFAESLRQELLGLIAREERVEGTPLDEESRRKLEALGYVSGSSRSPDFARTDPKDRLDVYLIVNDPSFDSIEPSDPGFEEAIRRLEETLERDPTIPRVYVLLGDLLLKTGRPEKAESIFASLVELEPRDFHGQYGLGVARARQGRSDAALDSLERALEIEPRNTKTHFQLADVEAARGNWEAAEAWLRKALAIHSDSILKSRLAEVLVQAGKREEARAVLSQWREDDSDPRASYQLGKLLLLEGDVEGAVRELLRAVAIEPRDPEAHQALGSALAAAGRLEEAAGSYREAVALSPCFAQALSNLGSAYAQTGRFAEAARALEKAVACDPSYSVAYKNLAAVKLEMGEVGAAVSAMRKAVEASPEDDELRRLLRELEAHRRSR